MAWRERARNGVLPNNPEASVWGIVDQLARVPENFCVFIHEAHISPSDLDGDGDALMADSGVPGMDKHICKCMAYEWSIPDCFLVSFFYMLATSALRSGRLKLTKELALEMA